MTQPGRQRRTLEASSTLKKRAWVAQFLENNTEKIGGAKGKRKVMVLAEDGEADSIKKGRKIKANSPSARREQAEAGDQPHPLQ